MSEDVLTGPFLDFGTSFWGTSLMHSELPGLESKGFTSTGKYGIGFFSVFMWGERVQVITRRPERAREDTLILEFDKGLTSRPLLRKAKPPEFLRDGGTRVRVWLAKPEAFMEILSSRPRRNRWTLEQRCAWLCPTVDVNLYIDDKNKVTRVIAASDWTTIKGVDLLTRILGPLETPEKSELVTVLRDIGARLQPLKSTSGEVIGRACIFKKGHTRASAEGLESRLQHAGLVTIGGFRSSGLMGIVGILVGNAHSASRDLGVPVVEPEVLRSWSTEQAKAVRSYVSNPEDLSTCAEVIRCCGGDTEELPIAISHNGWVSGKDIAERTDLPEEILLVQDAALSNAAGAIGAIELYENVFAVAAGWPGILQTRSVFTPVDWPPVISSSNLSRSAGEWTNGWWSAANTLEGAVIQAIAKAWKVPLIDVLEASDQSTDAKSIKREVGNHNNDVVALNVVAVIRKPEAKTTVRRKR